MAKITTPGFDARALFDDIDEAGTLLVRWSVLYPVVIARIREVAAAGDGLTPEQGGERGLPSELIDAEHRGHPDVDPLGAARRLRRLCRRMPATAWDDALLPREQFADVPTPGLSPEQYVTAATADDDSIDDRIRRLFFRAAALEYARLWFTRAIKNQMQGQLKLKLIPDDRGFRL